MTVSYQKEETSSTHGVIYSCVLNSVIQDSDARNFLRGEKNYTFIWLLLFFSYYLRAFLFSISILWLHTQFVKTVRPTRNLFSDTKRLFFRRVLRIASRIHSNIIVLHRSERFVSRRLSDHFTEQQERNRIERDVRWFPRSRAVAARKAHNLEVVCSIHTSATIL